MSQSKSRTFHQLHFMDPEDILGLELAELASLGQEHNQQNELALAYLSENGISYRYKRFNVEDRFAGLVTTKDIEVFNEAMARFQKVCMRACVCLCMLFYLCGCGCVRVCKRVCVLFLCLVCTHAILCIFVDVYVTERIYPIIKHHPHIVFEHKCWSMFTCMCPMIVYVSDIECETQGRLNSQVKSPDMDDMGYFEEETGGGEGGDYFD